MGNPISDAKVELPVWEYFVRDIWEQLKVAPERDGVARNADAPSYKLYIRKACRVRESLGALCRDPQDLRYILRTRLGSI